MTRFVIDTVFPTSSDGIESFIVYDILSGKYVSEHYFDYDEAEAFIDEMESGV